MEDKQANPLMDALIAVAERDSGDPEKPFDPQKELGLDAEQLTDVLSELINEIKGIGEVVDGGNTFRLVTIEDVAYLALLSLTVGVEYGRKN